MKTYNEINYNLEYSVGEPNNYGGKELCMDITVYDVGRWNDNDCKCKFPAVCKKPGKYIYPCNYVYLLYFEEDRFSMIMDSYCNCDNYKHIGTPMQPSYLSAEHWLNFISACIN